MAAVFKNNGKRNRADDVRSILLIEDNAGDAYLAEEHIKTYLPGAQVQNVKDFCAAQEALRHGHRKFDVVLLDLTLPDKRGTELVASVMPLAGETPVIVLTGYSDESFSLKTLEYGVSDYMLKGEFNGFALCKSILYAVEKNRMHKALESANKNLTTAMEIARLGHWFYCPKTKRFRCSAEMCEILGLEAVPTDIGFLSYCRLLLPEDLEDFKDQFFGALRGDGMNETEHRILCPDESVKHLYLRGEPVFDEQNDLIGIEGIVQDITGRKNQEAQKQLLESVITHAKDAVVISEAESTAGNLHAIVYINKAFTELTGYAKHEVLGRSPEFLYGPDTDAAAVRRFEEALAAREACQLEMANYKKDGNKFWVELSVVPVKDKRGFCTHFISIERDITERKAYEHLLIKLSQNLERKIAMRTSELESAHKLLNYHYTELKNSMVYAQTVQRAVLGKEQNLTRLFRRAFLFSEPRDIVTGDFLWCCRHPSGLKMAAVADCTGHGLHGALLSMIAHQLLNQSVNVRKLTDPSEILTDVHNELHKIYRPDEQMALHYNGMDVALTVYDQNSGELSFSGARRHLYYIREGKVRRLKGSKFTVGEAETRQIDQAPVTQVLTVEPDDAFYLTSDGLADQFGGPDGRKLMDKGLQKALQLAAGKTFGIQKQVLTDFFRTWKGGREQTDDVLLAAFSL